MEEEVQVYLNIGALGAKMQMQLVLTRHSSLDIKSEITRSLMADNVGSYEPHQQILSYSGMFSPHLSPDF